VRLRATYARALVLAVWAAFFIGLWATGETSRYLGPRTYWVVPFGALTLGFAALAYGLYAFRSPRRDQLRLTEAAGLFAMIVPVFAVLLVPRAELGALAASRKATSRSFTAQQLAKERKPDVAKQSSKFDTESLMDVAAAAADPAYATNLGLEEGSRVRLFGFVMAGSAVDGASFELARFVISCCAADAVPVRVPVDSGDLDTPQADTWLTVVGGLSKQGSNYLVEAEELKSAPAPDDPYMTVWDWG
jgi:uncharacterized repeat protein (TIGR03943 family)